MKPGIPVLALLLSAPLAGADAPTAQPTSRTQAPAETRISIDFKDVDVVDVVRMMAEVAGFQVVVYPGISCKLTLKLNDVRWVQALDLSLKACGLGSEEENGVIRVATLATLSAEHQAQRKLDEERALSRPMVMTSYRLSYARASAVGPLLKQYLSPKAQVVVDERTNTLFIKDVQ